MPSGDTSMSNAAQAFCNHTSVFQRSLVEDMNRREKELAVQSERLEKDMAAVQSKLETVSKAERRLVKVQRQLAQTEAALQAKTEELAQLSANYAKMKQHVVNLEQRLESRAINIVTAEGQITLERQRLAELKKKANDMIGEATTAKEEATKLCTRYLSDKAKLEEKQANYQLLQLETKELKRKLEEMEHVCKLRDEEYACLRVRQESEAKRLQQERDHLDEKDRLCSAREAAMALRERELERMITEIERLHQRSSVKASSIELEHEKMQLQHNCVIDSLTYRIKAKETEIAHLAGENARLKSLSSKALSHDSILKLQQENRVLSKHVEELSAHLQTANSALENLHNDYLTVLENNRNNVALIDHLQEELRAVPLQAGFDNEARQRAMSPAAKRVADRIANYSSILSRSQPADFLRSVLNRRKAPDQDNENLLDIMDLQQSNMELTRSVKVHTNQHSAQGKASRKVGMSEDYTSNVSQATRHNHTYEQKMMRVEDSLSALHRDFKRATIALLARMDEVQTREKLAQSLCTHIKDDAELILVEKQDLERRTEDLNNFIREEAEKLMLNGYGANNTTLGSVAEEKTEMSKLFSAELKKSINEVLKSYRQMPDEEARYVTARIISHFMSAEHADTLSQTFGKSIRSVATSSHTTADTQQNAFVCKFCGALNDLQSSQALVKSVPLISPRASKDSKVHAASDVADGKTRDSALYSKLSNNSLRASQQRRSVSTPQQSSAQTYLEASSLAKDTDTISERLKTPLKSTTLQTSNGVLDKGHFSMLNATRKDKSYLLGQSQTAMDLSQSETEQSQIASAQSFRSRSLGKVASNTDSRNVRFSAVVDQSDGHPYPGEDMVIQSALLDGGSIHTLASYLRKNRDLRGNSRPINLVSSSETMASLIDPSPSTDRTTTANTSSMSNTSMGSVDRNARQDPKPHTVAIENVLSKSEQLLSKPLPFQHRDAFATQTSISVVSRPGSLYLPHRTIGSSGTGTAFTDLPDSQLLRQVEDILNQTKGESTALDPPSLSQSGGPQSDTYVPLSDSMLPQPQPQAPLSASRLSNIYGTGSMGHKLSSGTLSDDIGGSDSCIYV